MKIKYRTELFKLLEYFNLKGDACEIGVAEGRNSEIIISWPQVERLYMIDAWQKLNQKGDGGFVQAWHDLNYKEALERTERFKDKRIILRGLSSDMIKQMPDNSLVLAYVDGDHSYEGCLNDLRLIWPKLKNGAILAGHDYLNPAYGVREAVKQFQTNVYLSSPNSVWTEINIIEEDEMPMAGFWILKN